MSNFNQLITYYVCVHNMCQNKQKVFLEFYKKKKNDL